MSLTAARWIWTTIGLTVFVVAFNLFSATQSWGAKVELPVQLSVSWDDARPLDAALFGAFLIPFGILVLTRIGVSYAATQRRDGARWMARVPTAFPGIASESRAGGWLASLALFSFVILPAYASGHFARKVSKGLICRLDGQSTIVGEFWQGGDGERWRLSTDSTHCEGAQFYPLWEPLAWSVLAIGATLSMLHFLWLVFCPPAKRHAGAARKIGEILPRHPT
jgi:hypothetical protein